MEKSWITKDSPVTKINIIPDSPSRVKPILISGLEIHWNNSTFTGLNLLSDKAINEYAAITNDNNALFKVKKLVINSLNNFLFKKRKIAVKNGRKIGSRKINSNLTS